MQGLRACLIGVEFWHGSGDFFFFFLTCFLQGRMRQAARRICFVTDLEGDISFFSKFVLQSDVLKFSPNGHLAWRRDANDVFVHGGDLFDRGPGDIRLSNMLCRFHDQFPDRGFVSCPFLLGSSASFSVQFSCCSEIAI